MKITKKITKKIMMTILLVSMAMGVTNPQEALAASEKYLGYYTVYAYSISGKTASGKTTKAGRTIAVDPKVIPLGSKLKVGGKTYIAEDTGGAIKGKKLDVYVSTEAKAKKWGIKKLKVYLIK